MRRGEDEPKLYFIWHTCELTFDSLLSFIPEKNVQGIIGLLYKLHLLWSRFQTCHNWSLLNTSSQVEMEHVLYIIPHAWWIVQHKSLHVILEEHGESFKLWTPIYERILIQIFVLAFAYITITSKLAKIFQIFINLSEVIFFAATLNVFKWMFELSLSMSMCWNGPSFALAMNYFSFVPNKYYTINIENLKHLNIHG